MRRHWPFFLALLVIAALFIGAEERFSNSFGQCVGEWTENAGQAKPNQNGFNITVIIESRAICTVRLIDKHSGFFAAIAAFIIAWFTWTLKGSTDNLWSTTNDTLAHAEKTAVRQLRAYVYLEISGRRYPPPPKVADRYSISLALKNSGSTWARHVQVRHGRIIDPTEPDPFAAMKWDEITPHPVLIGPGQEIGMQFGDLFGQQLHDILINKRRVFFVAWVTYFDTLSEPPITRQTQLFRQLNVDEEGGVSFSWMPIHNCADEDCL